MELFKRWFSQRNQGTLYSNVWDFDVGKFVVPGVFVDKGLLVAMVKKYDPILRLVKNYFGERLFEVSTTIIREVFMLNKHYFVGRN